MTDRDLEDTEAAISTRAVDWAQYAKWREKHEMAFRSYHINEFCRGKCCIDMMVGISLLQKHTAFFLGGLERIVLIVKKRWKTLKVGYLLFKFLKAK